MPAAARTAASMRSASLGVLAEVGLGRLAALAEALVAERVVGAELLDDLVLDGEVEDVAGAADAALLRG